MNFWPYSLEIDEKSKISLKQKRKNGLCKRMIEQLFDTFFGRLERLRWSATYEVYRKKQAVAGFSRFDAPSGVASMAKRNSIDNQSLMAEFEKKLNQTTDETDASEIEE